MLSLILLPSSFQAPTLIFKVASPLMPEIDGEMIFPDAFEVYDPKVENNFEVKSGNLAGTKTIEYMFIPRRSGQYEIPSAELSYYDLTSKMYRTMRTPVFKLNVVKGEDGALGVLGALRELRVI